MSDKQTDYKRSERVEILVAYKHYIGLATIGIIAAIALTGNLDTVIELVKSLTKVETYPVWLRLLVGTIIGGGLLTGLVYIVLSWVGLIDFAEPDWVRVYEVDASRGELVKPWNIAPQRWDNREMVSGQLHTNKYGIPLVKELKIAEDSTLLLRGIPLGELSEVDLLSWRHGLEEQNGRQRFWALVGQTLDAKMPYYIREMYNSITNQVVRNFIKKTSPESGLSIYESEFIRDADKELEGLDVPETYFTDDFEREVTEAAQEDFSQMVNEDTEGAYEAVSDDE